jgi:hypothetical protein
MEPTTEIILFQQRGIFLCCMLVASSPPRHPHRRSASMGSTRLIRLYMVCSFPHGFHLLENDSIMPKPKVNRQSREGCMPSVTRAAQGHQGSCDTLCESTSEHILGGHSASLRQLYR